MHIPYTCTWFVFRYSTGGAFDLFTFLNDGKLNFTGPAIPADPEEAGWKDTVRADPEMVTRIIVPFEPFAGRYVWHCHVLEHEDNGIVLVRLGEKKMAKTADLLPGTLDMLILKAVSLKPLHGYGVLQRIRQISGEALDIPQGSLYPALYRLEHQDLIVAEWGVSENNRRAKYYTTTAAGRRRLREEAAGWNRLASAIAAALNTTPEEV